MGAPALTRTTAARRAAAIVRGAMRQGDNRVGPASGTADAGPPAAGPVLVVTKLRAPTVRAELVPRRRLIDLLVRRGPPKPTLTQPPGRPGETNLLGARPKEP